MLEATGSTLQACSLTLGASVLLCCAGVQRSTQDSVRRSIARVESTNGVNPVPDSGYGFERSNGRFQASEGHRENQVNICSVAEPIVIDTPTSIGICSKPGQYTICAQKLLKAGLTIEGECKVQAIRLLGKLKVTTSSLAICKANLLDTATPVTITSIEPGTSEWVQWVIGTSALVLGMVVGIGLGNL